MSTCAKENKIQFEINWNIQNALADNLPAEGKENKPTFKINKIKSNCLNEISRQAGISKCRLGE